MLAYVSTMAGGGVASGVTSRTYSPQAGIQTGDYMFVCHLLSGTRTISAPGTGSWTNIASYATGGIYMSAWVGVRGSGDTSYAFTCTGGSVDWRVGDHWVRMLASQAWSVSSVNSWTSSGTTSPELPASPVASYDSDMVLGYFCQGANGVQTTTSPVTNANAFNVFEGTFGTGALIFRVVSWSNIRKTVGVGNTLQIPAQTWSNNNSVPWMNLSLVLSDSDYAFPDGQYDQIGTRAKRLGYSESQPILSSKTTGQKRVGVIDPFRDLVEPAYGGSIAVR